jgi:hypothetical protein
MRLENEQPISKVELEIQEILELNGIAAEDIQFRGEQRYLRVGYWRQLSQTILEQLGQRVTGEVDFYDDDCGWLYNYDVA